MAPVHELEQLDRELDVADPAATALELTVIEAPALRLAFGPGLHRADLAHGVRPEDVRPHEWLGRIDERGAGAGIAGYRARLDQRLELPALRPLLPPRDVRVDAPGECSCPAFGSEVRVGAEDDPGRSRFGHDREHPARIAVGGFGRVRPTRLVYEEHVDVRRVVQLDAAELAHPDDGERDLRFRQLERRSEAGLREPRELAPDGGEIRDPQEVARGDPEVLAPLPPAQLVFIADRRGGERCLEPRERPLGYERLRVQ